MLKYFAIQYDGKFRAYPDHNIQFYKSVALAEAALNKNSTGRSLRDNSIPSVDIVEVFIRTEHVKTITKNDLWQK